MSSENTSLWPVAAAKTDLQSLQGLWQSLLPLYLQLLEQEAIAASAAMTALLGDLYLPLADWLHRQLRDKTLVVGLNGAQGSGKSTLATILAGLLQQGFDCRVQVLSIDDFYLSREQRQQLASTVHPLLLTRGVPGTHDVALLQSVLRQLQQKTSGELALPVFDKARDDRLPDSSWRRVTLPVDMVIFEGWCVAATAEEETALSHPVNQLEADADPHGHWRHYVNQQLGGDYQQLFGMLDVLLMLQAPSWQKVYDWRLLQEQKLRQKNPAVDSSRIMSDGDVRRFIMHYERITRHCLDQLPERADLVLRLNHDHGVDQVILNTQG